MLVAPLILPCAVLFLPVALVQSRNLMLFINGTTFRGRAFYSDEITVGIGSCGYTPESVGKYVAGMPFDFMPMSRNNDICNTMCNELCGGWMLVVNPETQQQIQVLVMDSASSSAGIVLSKEAFEAVGGTIKKGYVDVDFQIVALPLR